MIFLARAKTIIWAKAFGLHPGREKNQRTILDDLVWDIFGIFAP